MNGYFQLIDSGRGTEIKLIPPTEGGAEIDAKELAAYLQQVHVQDVDLKEVYAVLRVLREERVIRISPVPSMVENEKVNVIISEDKMSAKARFYAPSSTGKRLSKEDIIHELNYRDVKAGIDEAAVEAFVANPQYCTDILIATGKEPVQGQDAQIEYFFKTEVNTRPKRNDDGSVDFFHLDTIQHCKKGDVLAKLVPEVKGIAGGDVTGNVISPREVKRKVLKCGRNITLSEDGLTLTSDIDGHVTLVDDKVFVSDVYEVENVGPATGNIDAQGSVVVNGNVQAGYEVKASGNVEVRGIVEGAVIEAGGDIIIVRGMNGMNKGFLKAGGSIISKFFENSTIHSGSFVEADSIIHSNVVAKTEVIVDGRKGFIAGGSVRATDKISCKTLGSAMGADTYVEVGIDPSLKKEYQNVQKEIVETQKSLKSIQPILINLTNKIKKEKKHTPEQLKYLQSLLVANKQQTEHLKECQQKYEEIGSLLDGQEHACVCVSGDAYAGTKIAIMDASIVLKNTATYCRFVYDRGDVKIGAY